MGAWDSIKSGLGAAKNWIADTAMPATSNGFAYVGAAVLSPALKGINAAGEFVGVDIISDDNYIVNDINRRHDKMISAISGFGEYTSDNPQRAIALGAQGVVNAGTSIVAIVPAAAGLVGDLVSAIPDYTLRPLVNLARDNDNQIESSDFFGFTKKLYFGEELNELGQIKNYVDSKYLDRINPKDENASYERVLLYGPQAVAEIGVFWGVSVLTAGVGGAALATSRITSLGAKTVGQAKNADMLKAGINTAEKLTKAEEKLHIVQNSGGTARQIAKAEKQVEKAEKAFVKIEKQAERIGSKRAEDAVKKTTVAEAIVVGAEQVAAKGVQATAKTSEKASVTSINTTIAEVKLANTTTVKMSVAEQQAVAQQSKNVIQINAKSAQTTANSEVVILNSATARTTGNSTVTLSKSGVTGANTTKATKTTVTSVNEGVTTVNSGGVAANSVAYTTPSTLQRMKNGFNVSAYKTNKWISPKQSPKIELAGAGLAFGLGVKADIAQGEAHMGIDDASLKAMTDNNRESVDRGISGLGASLSQNFGNKNSGAIISNNGAVSDYSGTSTNQTSTEFNNTVYGIRVSLNQPITIVVSAEDALEIENSLKS